MSPRFDLKFDINLFFVIATAAMVSSVLHDLSLDMQPIDKSKNTARNKLRNE